MLLGLNFLRRVGASANLASDILTIGNEQVKMIFGGTSDSIKRVSRVTVAERVTIPPRTIARIPCKLNTPLLEYVVEPSNNLPLNTIMPRTYHDRTNNPFICLINTGDEKVTVNPNKVIGSACEAYEAKPFNFINTETVNVHRLID